MKPNVPELTDTLKKLKLSGMMDCLQDRLSEATANQMSHSEFLALIANDELLARQQRNYERRYKKASFRGVKTIENFDFSFNPKVNQALIRELATCRFIKEKNPVLIVGPCGTGKTHIAQALGHAALQKGYEVLCTTQSKLSEELQLARAVNAYAKKVKVLAKIPLLIIDDFGLKPLRPPQDEDLHDLIDERYEQRSTIITSNLDFSEWGQAFPNKLLGAATLDRLRHNAYRLVLEGESYRKLRENNNQTGRGAQSEK